MCSEAAGASPGHRGEIDCRAHLIVGGVSGLQNSGARRHALPNVSRSLQILALVVLLLILGATAQQLLQIRSAVLAQTEQQMARLDMVFAEQTGRAVETVDFVLRAIAALSAAKHHAPTHGELVEGHFVDQTQGVRQLSRIAVVDAAGRIVIAEPPTTDTELPPAGRALLGTIAHGDAPGPFISEPIRETDGAWHALMIRPIREDGRGLSGAVVAWINLAYFEDFYRSVELEDNGAIILHRRDGTVLARFPHSEKAIGTSFADLPPFKDILAHEMAGTVLMDSPIDGSTRVLAIRALKAFPLAVQVSVDEARALAGWRRQAWTFAFLALVACTIIVSQLLMLARRSREAEALAVEFRAASETAQTANIALREQMSERERAEAALRQAQRIEAVGRLTGGVAHDFNNLLTVILGNIDLIEASNQRGLTRIAERLMAMRGAAERGARLTGQLLAFAKRQPLVARAVDLNMLIHGMEGLLRSAIGARVGLHLDLAPGLWPALVDPTQIELVILNLAINARDAMPSGGDLTIVTANARLPPPDKPERPAAGDYVMVSVADTGAGMDPEVLARAFEPFFTTKPVGSGSGLGLSQVLGTARQSGGDASIDSKPGQGTIVRIHLPRATIPAPLAPGNPPVTSFAPSEHGMLLLVDDDEQVRTTTAEMLRSGGFTVAEATDGAEALDWLRREPRIAVMLTDVVMPGMNGVALAEAAHSVRPGIQILFMSGFADLAGVIGGETIATLIRKPFRQSELMAHVARGLQEHGTRAE